MVWNALISLLMAPVVLILEAVPSVTYPEWFTGGCPVEHSGGELGELGHPLGCYGAYIGRAVGRMNAWLPADVFLQCVTVLVAVWGVTMAISGVRRLVSLLTGGGGS